MTLEPPAGSFVDLSVVHEEPSTELNASDLAKEHWVVATAKLTHAMETLQINLTGVNEIKPVILMTDKVGVHLKKTLAHSAPPRSRMGES